eukprot:Amastigsp_a508575_51.p3 type:complete len:144 gc:universal Amastigsp_a508575_51:1814-1383(-)
MRARRRVALRAAAAQLPSACAARCAVELFLLDVVHDDVACCAAAAVVCGDGRVHVLAKVLAVVQRERALLRRGGCCGRHSPRSRYGDLEALAACDHRHHAQHCKRVRAFHACVRTRLRARRSAAPGVVRREHGARAPLVCLQG